MAKSVQFEFGQGCHYCRRRVYARGSAECRADPWCQATKEHLVPKHIAGPGVHRNTVIACLGCNHIKNGHPPEVFESFIKSRGGKGHPNVLRNELNRYAYDLARVGLVVAKAYAIAERKQTAANDAGRARDSKGRFVKRTA